VFNSANADRACAHNSHCGSNRDSNQMSDRHDGPPSRRRSPKSIVQRYRRYSRKAHEPCDGRHSSPQDSANFRTIQIWEWSRGPRHDDAGWEGDVSDDGRIRRLRWNKPKKCPRRAKAFLDLSGRSGFDRQRAGLLSPSLAVVLALRCPASGLLFARHFGIVLALVRLLRIPLLGCHDGPPLARVADEIGKALQRERAQFRAITDALIARLEILERAAPDSSAAAVLDLSDERRRRAGEK
jgi:hypothetical protein